MQTSKYIEEFLESFSKADTLLKTKNYLSVELLLELFTMQNILGIMHSIEFTVEQHKTYSAMFMKIYRDFVEKFNIAF